MVRSWISAKTARHSNLEEKSNWNAAALRNVKMCPCHRGNIRREKNRAANEKRRKFYKTEKSIDIKKIYKERLAMKKSLLRQLLAISMRKKCRE